MPRCHVLHDLKAHIPYLQCIEDFIVKEIGWILSVKKSMIYQTLNYYRDYGITHNPMAFTYFTHGQHHILTTGDLDLVKSLLSQEPTMYLNELQYKLLMHRNVVVFIPTILRSLHHLHFSYKSVSIHALERNNMDCAIYMNWFAEMVTDPAMVILDGIIAHDIIPGSVTSNLFVKFLHEYIICCTLFAACEIDHLLDSSYKPISWPLKCVGFKQLQYPPFRNGT